jgi:GDPmannose 4,6-dehydratase
MRPISGKGSRPLALITGITGQDGSYLAEFLLHKGYEVHGTIRRSSTFNTRRIDHIYQDPHEKGARLFLHYCDMTTGEQLATLIGHLQPDEVYHLAAQSHVQVSFEVPEYTAEVTGVGTVRVLEAILRNSAQSRFYQAASSEMFGDSPPPQNERTQFHPRSPYAAAKVFAYWVTKMYRDGYGLFASSGILFNHESPRRGETFVSRKVTRAIAAIKTGQQDRLYLGNLDAKRDWGYAPEYVELMWRMLQEKQPQDYVIGTGESHSVREFVQEAFSYAGLDWRKHVEHDPRYDRPLDVNDLQADPSLARSNLGWEPKVGFHELVRIMVDADLEAAGLTPVGEGKSILRAQFGEWHDWTNGISRALEAAAGRALS